MEFKMSAVTKRVSISILLAVGIALGAPLSIPALSAPAQSNVAKQEQAAPPLRTGDLVRVRSGGPLMTVTGVEGDQVKCSWTDWDGQFKSGSFPITVLGEPLTLPPDDPSFKQDERAVEQYYQKDCPSGSVSIATGKFECAY
jgi:uncharacterized protein YodC (DUF2158 family)